MFQGAPTSYSNLYPERESERKAKRPEKDSIGLIIVFVCCAAAEREEQEKKKKVPTLLGVIRFPCKKHEKMLARKIHRYLLGWKDR